MKKIILTLAAVCMMVCAQAQSEVGHFSLTPQVGLTESIWSTSCNSGLHTPPQNTSTGFRAGIELQHQTTSVFAPSVGVFYNFQAGKSDDSDIKNLNIQTIDIPVMLNFYLGSARNWFVKAGFQYSVLSSAKIDGEDVKKACDMKNLMYIPVGFGFCYGGWTANFLYHYGLNKAIEDGASLYWSNWDVRADYFTVTLGYRFDL